MDQAKKIAIAVFAVAMVALGVAVAYAYTVSSSVPSNYGYNTSPYGNAGPYGSYDQGVNNGAYGYGSPGYGMGRGMISAFGSGMMGGW